MYDLSDTFAMKTTATSRVWLTAASLFSVLSLAANRSDAAEWWLAPALRLDAEYNDNFTLTTLPHKSTRGTTISPSLAFGVGSDVWTVNGNAEFVRQSYSDVNNAARDSQNYSLSTQYATERTTWRLTGTQSDSLLLVSQTGDPAQQVKRRQANSFGPSWSWLMTELTQLQLSYQKSSLSYEDGLRFGLSDYDAANTTAGLLHKLSPESTVFINFGYSTYEVPAEPFKSRGTSTQVGATHSFSETLRATLSVGAQRNVSDGFVRPRDQCSNQLVSVDISNPFNPIPIFEQVCVSFPKVEISQDKTISLLNAQIDKQYDTTRVNATLSRSLDPSGSGTITRTDTLGLHVSRPFTPLLTGNLSVDIYDFRSTLGDVAGTNRTFYQVSPSLRWQLAQEWNFETSFRYSILRRDNDSRDAIGRSILLRLIYQGTKMSVSR